MDPLAPFRVLVLGNQELVAEIERQLAFLEPSFPTDRESASFSNEMFCEMNPGIPKHGLEAIKCLHEYHSQACVVSLKCAQGIIPLCLYENVFNFRYGFEQLHALWLGSVQLPSFSRRNHDGHSSFDGDNVMNVDSFISKPIPVCF